MLRENDEAQMRRLSFDDVFLRDFRDRDSLVDSGHDCEKHNREPGTAQGEQTTCVSDKLLGMASASKA
jgi:hypothetical protein